MGPKIPPMPEPQKVPPPPDKSADEVQKAGQEQRNRFFSSQGGMAQTMLTGGQGAAAPSTAVRFLGNVGR